MQCFQVSLLNDSVVEDTEAFNISIAVANQIFDVTQPSSVVVSIVDSSGNAILKQYHIQVHVTHASTKFLQYKQELVIMFSHSTIYACIHVHMSSSFTVVEVSLEANTTTVKEGSSIELTVTKLGEASIPVSVLLFTDDDTAKGKHICSPEAMR